jgi:hypothetical protein
VFLVIAGCGGDSGVDTNSDAYQGGFDVCHNTPVDQHALELGVEAEPEAIADAIGFAVAGQRTGSDYEDAKQGCLDAYAEDS